jgi:hypothetical protein
MIAMNCVVESTANGAEFFGSISLSSRAALSVWSVGVRVPPIGDS